jgi:hypothetical protein
MRDRCGENEGLGTVRNWIDEAAYFSGLEWRRGWDSSTFAAAPLRPISSCR